jgi:hypothetical protein
MRIRFLLAAPLLCAAASAGFGQSYGVTGYLLDGRTDQPMAGIRMHIFRSEENDPVPPGGHGPAAPPVTSERDGRFAFSDLRRGQYVLQAELPHEAMTYQPGIDPLGRYEFSIGPETDGRPIVFRILPPASLAGTVRDNQGDPMPDTAIEYYRRGRRGGRIELLFCGSAGTDQRGDFLVENLSPGDYVLCAKPQSSRRFAPSAVGELAYVPGGSTRVYAPACFPKSGGWVHLARGGQQRVDFKLTASPGVTVRANGPGGLFHKDMPGYLPVSRFDTQAIPGGGTIVPHVPPGRYVFKGTTGDRTFGQKGHEGWSLTQDVAVEAKPVEIEVRKEKRGSIEWHLHATNGRPVPPDAASVAFFPFEPTSLVARLGHGEQAYNATPVPVYWGLDPGEYWLSTRVWPPWCVESTTLAGGTLANGILTVTAEMQARLDLNLGTNCGILKIRTEVAGVPVPFAAYLLLLNGTPQEPGDAITGSTDAQGCASLPYLGPGQYQLWAWKPDAEGYIGPELAQTEGEAITIAVVAGRPTSVSIAPGTRSGGGR